MRTTIIATDVLAVLSASAVTGNELRLPGTLERKMYQRVNEVLETAGWKWNRKAKAHICDGEAVDELDNILLTGTMTKLTAKTKQQEFGFFETPPLIVERMMRAAKIAPHDLVLEPSAGKGAIVKALLERNARVICWDILPENYEALNKLGINCLAAQSDFLQVKPSQQFDRVVMNPPFARQADIRHVMHAEKFLRPDGKLVAIMSAGVTFREDRLTKSFLELVERRGGEIEELPAGSFKESGTMVNTVMVVM